MRVMVNILYLMNACYLNKTITSERKKKLLSPPRFPCFCKAFRAFKDNEVTIIITLIFFSLFTLLNFVKNFTTVLLSQWDFSHGKFGLLFPGENQPRQSRAAQPTVHAGCFSVSIIHRTLTWTTGSLSAHRC